MTESERFCDTIKITQNKKDQNTASKLRLEKCDWQSRFANQIAAKSCAIRILANLANIAHVNHGALLNQRIGDIVLLDSVQGEMNQ